MVTESCVVPKGWGEEIIIENNEMYRVKQHNCGSKNTKLIGCCHNLLNQQGCIKNKYTFSMIFKRPF